MSEADVGPGGRAGLASADQEAAVLLGGGDADIDPVDAGVASADAHPVQERLDGRGRPLDMGANGAVKLVGDPADDVESLRLGLAGAAEPHALDVSVDHDGPGDGVDVVAHVLIRRHPAANARRREWSSKIFIDSPSVGSHGAWQA